MAKEDELRRVSDLEPLGEKRYHPLNIEHPDLVSPTRSSRVVRSVFEKSNISEVCLDPLL